MKNLRLLISEMEVLEQQFRIFREMQIVNKTEKWEMKMNFEHIKSHSNGWNTYKLKNSEDKVPEVDRLITLTGKLIFVENEIFKVKGNLDNYEIIKPELSHDFTIARFERCLKSIEENKSIILNKILNHGLSNEVILEERKLPVLKKHDILGIEGCPGAGKSTFCAKLIENYCEKYVLFYFAPTHHQICNMAEKLIKNNLSFVIMSDESKLPNNLTKYHVANGDEFNPKTKNSVPKRVRIILSTINKPLKNLKYIENSIVIIDEAGRVSLLEAVHKLTKIKLLVLAGDSRQLECHNTTNKQLVSSLRHIKKCNAKIIKIRDQFRFDGLTNYIISTSFYEAEMIPNIEHNSKFIIISLENCIHDKTRTECEIEAKLVKCIEDQFYNHNFNILTPYKTQLELLNSIGVDSQIVETSQGCEYDHVILSIGRTDGIGFLNRNRLNVAMSRCSKTLIVISHDNVIKKNPILKNIQKVAENNLCSLIFRNGNESFCNNQPK